MAINRNDDYEKLAKLLYPSIEASGNTYYGQTRRLTLDEVFNKNNGGFESHIESVRVDNPFADYGFTYDTLFCWKVGPLSGTLKVDAEYNIGTYFAIYEIVSESVTNVNQLNSGEFNTYEYNTSCEFKEIKETDGKSPVNITEVYDGRNFYIYKDGIKNYIAVAVNVEVEVPYDENNPLKLTAVNDDATIDFESRGSSWLDSEYSTTYECRSPASQNQWVSYNLDVDSIVLHPGESAYFRVKSTATKNFSQDKYATFVISSSLGSVEVSGDIRSMQTNKSEMSPYEFYYLFYNCGALLKAPDLPAYKAAAYCYCNMFGECISLLTPPKLELRHAAPFCCDSMFNTCTSLEKSPIIKVVDYDSNYYEDGEEFTDSYGCFLEMFLGCQNLHDVSCYKNALNSNDQTNNWLNDCANNGTFNTLSDTQWELDSDSGIPENWDRVDIEPENEPTNYETDKKLTDVLITSGSNSAENGRGSVISNSTLYNMENSFDESGTHQMNTYNVDGSFNQEIWGYKCFNSPVQFKNGIYGEKLHIVADKDNITSDYEYNLGGLITMSGNRTDSSSGASVINNECKSKVSSFEINNTSTSTISYNGNSVITSNLSNGCGSSILSGDAHSLVLENSGDMYKFTGGIIGTVSGDSRQTIVQNNNTTIKDTHYCRGSIINNYYNDNDKVYYRSAIQSDVTKNTSSVTLDAVKTDMSDDDTTGISTILHQSRIILSADDVESKITIDSDTVNTEGNILPNINERYNLGNNVKKWKNIYCSNIYADNIDVSIPEPLTCDRILPKTSGQYCSVGASDAQWRNVYTQIINANTAEISSFATIPIINFNSTMLNCYIAFENSNNSNSRLKINNNYGDILIQTYDTNHDIVLDSSNDIKLYSNNGGVTLEAGLLSNLQPYNSISLTKNNDITIKSNKNVSIDIDYDNYLYLSGIINVQANSTLLFDAGSYIQQGIIQRSAEEFISASYISDYTFTTGSSSELDLKPGTIVLIYVHDTSGGENARYLYPGTVLIQGNTLQGYDIYLCRLKDGAFESSSDRHLKTGTKVRLMYEVVFTASNRYARVLAQVIQ